MPFLCPGNWDKDGKKKIIFPVHTKPYVWNFNVGKHVLNDVFQGRVIRSTDGTNWLSGWGTLRLPFLVRIESAGRRILKRRSVGHRKVRVRPKIVEIWVVKGSFIDYIMTHLKRVLSGVWSCWRKCSWMASQSPTPDDVRLLVTKQCRVIPKG